MSGYDLIASIVESLAWPLVLIFILYFYQKPIEELIQRLKSAKGPWGEAEFGEYENPGSINAIAAANPDLEKLDTLLGYLNNGPHSFEWFRDHSPLKVSDADFETLIREYPDLLRKVTVVSRDRQGNRVLRTGVARVLNPPESIGTGT